MQKKPADIEIDQPDFGIRIKNLRRDNDLSQQDLAELIDRSVDLVNLIERGKSFVSRPTLKRLAKVFRVSEMTLFDYSGNRAFIESGGLKWRASRKRSPLVVRQKKVYLRVSKKKK